MATGKPAYAQYAIPIGEDMMPSRPATRRFRMSCNVLAAWMAIATTGNAFGWSASGVVRSATGAPLAGVVVSVKDSASVPTVTTGATGSFTISSGAATGIDMDAVRNSIAIRKEGNYLLIRSPGQESTDLTLIDLSGAVLWRAHVALNAGEARVSMPVRTTAAILRMHRGDDVLSWSMMLQRDDGWVASSSSSQPALSARSAAAFPTLLFKKSGYQDTSYAMTSNAATGLQIVLRDAVAVATCPDAKLSAGDFNKTVSVKGVPRSYILHVPSGYKGTSAVPLVVDFHPIGGSATAEEGASPYKAVADADGAVTVYPNGIQSANMGQAWNVGPCCTTADDTDFARTLVEETKKLACINPKRVYAVGFSMGGGMTHYSACHLADVFAATAPAAFDLLTANVDACKPTRPITMVIFRSTGDPVVSYAGAYSSAVTGMPITFLGAKASFKKWAELDKCTGSPSAEDANGCSTYSTCADGVQVTLCTKQGGGHDYGNASVGWPILKKYTLP